MKTGPQNALTDITGLRVGHAEDHLIKTGTTIIRCDVPTIASVKILGGAPGTRDIALLEPENTVETINAIVLSGGSAFGLDAAGGVQQILRKEGQGFAIGPHVVPIVPSAILFDLINGGNKDWGDSNPYFELGKKAALAASDQCPIGSVGAGFGALTANFKGGLGTASTLMDNGVTIAALVAVNALGSATIGDSGHFWAHPFEIGDEFGGLGAPQGNPAIGMPIKFRNRQHEGTNTTIGVIATDAQLSKSAAKRLAIAAHDGFTRALWPSHTPLDGDLVFGLATGTSKIKPIDTDWIDMSAIAASTMARAIARGIFSATAEADDLLPSWKSQQTE